MNSFLHSIAVHEMLHPGMAGAMRLPRMGAAGMGAAALADDGMEQPQTGLSGFLDRLTGSPLSQIGMALLAGGGGGLGNAAAMLMQQNAYRQLAQRQMAMQYAPRVEHIGNQVGMLDPRTGTFTPTYTEPQAPTELERDIRLAGDDPSSAGSQALVSAILHNRADPVVNVPLGDGSIYMGPRSGLENALSGRSSSAPAAAVSTSSGVPGSLAPGLLKRAVIAAEQSPGDFNADGTPLRSPSGALYQMQVLPSTARQPGYGVPPAANDSPAEYDRVGTDYITALAKHYGSLPTALAAYNAGPGVVDRALASDSPLPSQAYVNRGMAAINGGNADIVAQARQAIAAGADPAQVRARAASMGVALP